jgi:hypothetical protein
VIAVLGEPPITRDGARAEANRELAKGIYHRYDDPWPVRAFNAVQHWLGRLLDDVARHSPGGGAGATAIVIAVAILLVLLRWRLGPIRRTARLARPVLGSADDATAAEYRRAAEAAAADERWSDAIVARMRALARGLEEAGVLIHRPGRTADELAAEIAADRPDAAAATAQAARIFDEVAYGERPGTSAGYDAVLDADNRLSTMASRR